MCLLVILFLCAAVIGRFEVPDNSRFGRINSRLANINGNKIPVSPLWELVRKPLIRRVVSSAETVLIGQNRKNSRFHWNSPELIDTLSRSEVEHG